VRSTVSAPLLAGPDPERAPVGARSGAHGARDDRDASDLAPATEKRMQGTPDVLRSSLPHALGGLGYRRLAHVADEHPWRSALVERAESALPALACLPRALPRCLLAATGDRARHRLDVAGRPSGVSRAVPVSSSARAHARRGARRRRLTADAARDRPRANAHERLALEFRW
jgi:hypothetical protein